MGSSSVYDSLLKDTKDNILSLLVSSPNKVTVERLRIEYKEMIGIDIPYRRLGYDALISFLNCINDKVVVDGYDCRTAIVSPVVSKNTEQISKFVSRQRVPRKKGRGRGVVFPQRRMFPTPRGPSNLNVNARPFFFEPGRTTSYGHGSYPVPINRYSPQHLPVFKRVPAFPYQLPTVTPKTYYSATNIIPAGEWNHCDRLPFQQKKPQPTISNYTAPQNSTYRIPPPSISTVSSESNSTESVVPPGHSHAVSNTICNNLKSLMKQHPKGIKCTMLAEVYLAQFGSVLDYEELGYESATKFTRDLSEIFHRERPVKNGDFILFDKTQEVPYSVLEEIKNEALQAEKNLLRPEDNTPEFSNVSLDELLIAELYPDDVMTCHDFIPRLWSDAFVKGADLDIIVSEVYDPTKFWFQIRGEEFADKMNSIMDAMDEFYNEYKTEYLMPPLTIVKEQYVAAIYFDEWHRAVIVNKDDDLKEAQCFFCDYGTVSRVRYDNLRFLHKKFSALAQQALRGRLDFITPIHATRFWPLASTELFVKTTTGKDLHCRVSAIDEEEWVVWMILTDRETPDVCCNEIFVNKRFATHDPDLFRDDPPGYKVRSNICRMSHMFPTFDQHEKGKAFTLDELSDMDRNYSLKHWDMKEYDIRRNSSKEDGYGFVDGDNAEFHYRMCKDMLYDQYYHTPKTKEEHEYIARINALEDEEEEEYLEPEADTAEPEADHEAYTAEPEAEPEADREAESVKISLELKDNEDNEDIYEHTKYEEQTLTNGDEIEVGAETEKIEAHVKLHMDVYSAILDNSVAVNYVNLIVFGNLKIPCIHIHDDLYVLMSMFAMEYTTMTADELSEKALTYGIRLMTIMVDSTDTPDLFFQLNTLEYPSMSYYFVPEEEYNIKLLRLKSIPVVSFILQLDIPDVRENVDMAYASLLKEDSNADK